MTVLIDDKQGYADDGQQELECNDENVDHNGKGLK